MARKQLDRTRTVRSKRGEPTSTNYANSDSSIPRTYKPSLAAIEGKTTNQERYIKAIKSSILTFGTGPAGSGKTFISAGLAAQALVNGDVEQIIVTRPAVEAGESLGFLPGELEEKFEPYIGAFRQVMIERLGEGQFKYLMESGKIVAQPLAYMRGLTFKNAFVLMDEAQNATPKEMKLFLTRIGENTKVVVNGDLDQQDITGPSGLQDAIDRVSYIPSVRVVRFGPQDIVRSGFCQEVVTAYSQPIIKPGT